MTIDEILGVPYLDRGRDPESGLDCWGVVRWYLQREFAVDVPAYVGAYASAEESAEVAALISREAPTWVRVESPARGDVVLCWIRNPQIASHVGVYLGDRTMLHTRRSTGVVTERIDVDPWARRVAGYWRHAALAGAAPVWQLVACPNPIGGERLALTFPAGTTLLEALVRAGMQRDRDGGYFRVLVGDEEVPQAWWGRIKPKPGQLVTARSVPGDPVTLFFAIGGLAGSALIGTAASVAVPLSIAAGVLGTAAIYAGLAYAVTALGAPPEQKGPSGAKGPAESPQANGVGNQLQRWGKVRSGYGTMRSFPDLAAPAYTVTIGDEKFWRILLNVGRGRYQVDQTPETGRTGIEVGGVPIEDIHGAEWEIYEGGEPQSYTEAVLDTEPADDSPIGYWRMNDAGGSSTADDATGITGFLAQAGGVTFGGASIVPAVSGGSAAFDGTNDRLVAAAPPLESLAGDWTIECWCRSHPTSNGQPYWTVFSMGSAANGLSVAMETATGMARVEIPSVATYSTQVYIGSIVGSRSIARHLVLRRRDSKLELWVDGVRAYSFFDAHGMTTAPIAPTRFSVGARYTGSGSTYERFWRGDIQEFAVYDLALSDDEIRLHYDLGNEGERHLRLLSDSVFEVPINQQMPAPVASDGEWYASNWTTRDIPGEVDELSFEFFFPSGLYRISKTGDKVASSVGLDVEYRVQGGTWQKAADIARSLTGSFTQWFPTGTWGVGSAGNATPDGRGAFLVAGKVADAMLGGARLPVPIGRYEMRYRIFASVPTSRRAGGGDKTVAVIGDHELLLFRGRRSHAEPVRASGLCMVGLSLPVKETGSTVGEVSVLRRRMLRIYDPDDPEADTDGFTPYRVTDNAAWAYLDALIGPESINPRPVATWSTAASKVDLEAIKSFATRAKAWHGEIDFASNIWDVANMLLAPSFAAIGYSSGKWSVVEDRAGLTPVQLITPRNARGFRGTKRFDEIPHALRVAYLDASKGYQELEALVFDDGYSEHEVAGTVAASRYEQIDGRGITDRTEAIAYGKKRLRQRRLRDEEWTVEMFLDHLVAKRGDLVRAAIPMALIGQRTSRVKAISTSGGNVTAVTLEDRVSYTFGTLYGCRYRIQNGTAFAIQTADVTNPSPSGTVESTTVTFATPIPTATGPVVGSLFSFGERGSETVEALVRGIRRKGFMAELTLINYAPQVHNAVDEPATFEPVIGSPESLPTLAKPAAPAILRIDSDERYLAVTPTGLESQIRVVVQPRSGGRAETGAVRLRYSQRTEGTDPDFVVDSRDFFTPWVERFPAEIMIGPVEDGALYRIAAQAQTRDGVTSVWSAPMLHRVTGKLNPPPDVTEVRREGDEISWVYPTTVLDLDGFLVRYLHGQQPASLWDAALPAHGGVWRGTRFPFTNLPYDAQALTLLVKAVDKADVVSTNAARVVIPASFRTVNAVETIDHRTLGWTGTKTDCTVVSGDLAADETAGDDTQDAWLTDDNMPAWDVDDSLSAWASKHSLLAEYVAQWVPALEDVDDEVRVNAAWTPSHALVAGYYRELGPVAAWEDDDLADAWNASDSVDAWGDDEWSEWRLWPGHLGKTERKPYQFRVYLFEMMRNRPKLTQLQLITDADDVRETLRSVPISAAGSRLPITKTYRAIQFASVVSTSGKTAAVVDRETFGPFVECRDTTGALVADTVDAEIVGY